MSNLEDYYAGFTLGDLLDSMEIWTLLRERNRDLLPEMVGTATDHIHAVRHVIIQRCPEPALNRWQNA